MSQPYVWDWLSAPCECGERLYFLATDEPGKYRLRHGERPEAVSPVIDGNAGERSFAWREEVHKYTREEIK